MSDQNMVEVHALIPNGDGTTDEWTTTEGSQPWPNLDEYVATHEGEPLDVAASLSGGGRYWEEDDDWPSAGVYYVEVG